MAWSTVTIGMVSSKPEDCGVSFLSRSSYKVSMYTYIQCMYVRVNKCVSEFIYFVENNSIKTSHKSVAEFLFPEWTALVALSLLIFGVFFFDISY